MTDELNHYKAHLASLRGTTIPTARDAIYHGAGNPADSLLGDLSSGGWVCAKATEFGTAVRGKAGGILGAFDAAYGVVNSAWSAEPDRVPEGDSRGNKWPKQWTMRRI